MRRRRVGWLAALTVAAVLLGAAPAGAARNDTKAQREAVRRQRAAAAARVRALKDTEEQVSRALDALDANVRRQAVAVADARIAQAKAQVRLNDATGKERDAEARLSGVREAIRRVAVRAYMLGPDHGAGSAFNAESPEEASRRRQYFDFAVARRTDALDELRAVREDLTIARSQAESARKRAGHERTRLEGRLASLKLAEEEQEQVADAVEQRLDAALSEADSLAALDAELSAELARQQDALVSRLRDKPVRPGTGRTVQVGNVTVTSVGGIVVNVQIAGRVAALLTAAAADGIALGGGGYRNPQAQVALRRAHCGGSNFDVFQKPASRCRPPTARPGSSMHERGLAIDFTYQGRVIRSRSSPAWKWLNGNAKKYGLHNLRSEPWHWSTNGN